MSSSNRWARASAAEAQAKASSGSRRQDFPDSQYDDEVRHSSPPGGYAQRRIKETPSEDKRTPETAWFQARERLRKKRERNMHILMGPNNVRFRLTSNVHGCDFLDPLLGLRTSRI